MLISGTAFRRLRKHGVISLLLLLPAAAMGAETVATIRPDLETQIGPLLERIGQQVEKFWNNFSSVTCTESVTQAKLGEKGKVLVEQQDSFDYLIILQSSGSDLSVDESRVEKTHKTTKKGDSSLLETNGFSIFTLIFHPLYQAKYEFRRLPDEGAPGHRLIKIAFEQVSQDHPLSVLLLREREYPLQWRGTASIDPATFAVVHIEAGLGNTMADTGLLRLDTDVTYTDVRFGESTHYWLPSKAVIEAETKRQHWRNTHLFSNYKRFEVETQIKTANPQ